jgi:hypothetical protein
MEHAIMFNQQHMPPMQLLSDEEVLKVVASAWAYEARGANWIGRGARVVFGADEVDALAAHQPQAYALLAILRRHHAGTTSFVLSKAMADTLGWTMRAFKAARSVLVDRGDIECVHPGGAGPHDPPVFRFKGGQ